MRALAHSVGRDRRTGAPAEALPNLIVIGAMKCGTSALHYYLDLHPDISMSSPKELRFFLGEPVREGPFWSIEPERFESMRRARRNWSKGIDWYAGHFSPDARVRGESSPSYTAPWYPETAATMAKVVPETKLVFMVRDPIDRAVSQFLHLRADGRERRGLDEALADPRGYYVSRSRYHAVLEPFLRCFSAASVLVIGQEELLHRRRETMRAAYRFADVDESFWSPHFERERNRGGGKGGRYGFVRPIEGGPLVNLAYRLPEGVKWKIERLVSPRGGQEEARPLVDPALRDELAAYLRPDVARLRELTGKDFPEWSV